MGQDIESTVSSRHVTLTRSLGMATGTYPSPTIGITPHHLYPSPTTGLKFPHTHHPSGSGYLAGDPYPLTIIVANVIKHVINYVSNIKSPFYQ
jgi:hypothetical protein